VRIKSLTVSGMAQLAIIFDTIIIRKDPNPSSADWVEMRAAAQDGLASFFIPELVVSEYCTHLAESDGRRFQELRKAIDLPTVNILRQREYISERISQLISELHEELIDTAEPSRQTKKDNALVLFTRLTGQFSLIDLPTTTHAELIERCQNRRKPFTVNSDSGRDKGYKDALLWLSIVSFVKKKSQKSVHDICQRKS
jgi:hypothetical protein